MRRSWQPLTESERCAFSIFKFISFLKIRWFLIQSLNLAMFVSCDLATFVWLTFCLDSHFRRGLMRNDEGAVEKMQEFIAGWSSESLHPRCRSIRSFLVLPFHISMNKFIVSSEYKVENNTFDFVSVTLSQHPHLQLVRFIRCSALVAWNLRLR